MNILQRTVLVAALLFINTSPADARFRLGNVLKKTLTLKHSIATKAVELIQSAAKGGIDQLNIRRTYDNFDTVEDGKLYRSGQLTNTRLKYYVQKYGIKTIINLRGYNPDATWWQNEVDTAAELGVQHYDIAFSSDHFPTEEQIRCLLSLYKSNDQAILIHCAGGADRTGTAAALWKIEIQNSSTHEALKQLTPLYGHFESIRPNMRKFIREYDGIDNLCEETEIKEANE